MKDILTNDLYDHDDGCLNRLVIIGGLVKIHCGKRNDKITISEEDDTGWHASKRQATLTLPPGSIPDDIDLAPGESYFLVLVRQKQ